MPPTGALVLLFLPSPALAASVPSATAQSVTTREDTRLPVTLVGADPDGLTLTYLISSTLTRGSVSCVGRVCVYTPPSNFNGTDAFTFRVYNGTYASDPATISITVSPLNDAPTVFGKSALTVAEDRTRTVGISGSDLDGDTLVYQVSTAPAHGTASFSGSTLTYTPTADYSGTDSLEVRAYDGAAFSIPAAVDFVVAAMPDAPRAAETRVNTDEDVPLTFGLGATDADGDALTPEFQGVSADGSTWRTQTELRGRFTVSGLEVTYTPPADTSGVDHFRYRVSDGTTMSNWATVTVDIASVNDAPVLTAGWARAANGQPAHLTLTAEDVDGDPLSYSVIVAPRRGTATIWNGNQAVYRPTNPSVRTRDSFRVRVSDGALTDDEVQVIDITPGVPAFPVDTLPLNPAAVTSTTADGYFVFQLPTDEGDCERTESTQPRIQVTDGGAPLGTAGVVAGHYDTLQCGTSGFEDSAAELNLIIPTGVEGQYEARLLDTGKDVEAGGALLDDGSLLFSRVGDTNGPGGWMRYTPGSAADTTAITSVTATPLAVGTDSSPLYDPASGTTLMMSTVVPEVCGDPSDDDCGVIALVDAGGRLLDELDEADAHHAWGTGSCIDVYGERFCAFGPGSDASGTDLLDDNACAIVKIGGVPEPPVASGTVPATLSVLASVDPGAPGCTPVASLASAFLANGLVSDGTSLYAVALGSDQTDDTTRIYQYDLDLNEERVFEIPASYEDNFALGFQNALLIGSDGNLYMSGRVDIGAGNAYAVVRLDGATGDTDFLVSEPVGTDNAYGTGHLYLSDSGEPVIAYAVGETGVVTRLSDGATLEAYALAATTGTYTAAPVLISDSKGAADALMFVASDNVITIVPNTGLEADPDAPWPGPRRDERMQARFE